MYVGIAILALLIALYAAVAERLGRWSITMPMEMPELYQRRRALEGRAPT